MTSLRERLAELSRVKIIVDSSHIWGGIDDYLYAAIFYDADSLFWFWHRIAGKVENQRLYDNLLWRMENRLDDILLMAARNKLLHILQQLKLIKVNRLKH